jgi:sugar lactone lactonase YvrE
VGPAGVGDRRPGQNLLVVPLEAEPTPVRPARHGQGPVWDDGAGELLWVDAAGWIRWARVGPAGAVSDLAVRPVGEPVGAVALTTAPGWLLAAGSGFRRLTPDGEVGVLLDLDGPGRVCGGACDRAGRFLAGVTGLPETRGVGAVHRVDIDGVVSIALTDLEEPAAIAWSPDDDVLYLADSGARTVTAYDYDPDLGTADRPRVLLDFPMDEPAIPSGLTVDRAGHLWVSLTGGGQVRRYSSAGRPEEVLRVPVTQPTGCTFVGPALDILVVTTAVEGLSDVDRVVQPDAGRLFTVHVPDVVGRGTFRYRGPLGGLTAA